LSFSCYILRIQSASPTDKMVWEYVFFTWWCVATFVTGICINCLQLLVLPLFWIHRYTYHVVINKLSYIIKSHLSFLAEWWGTFDLRLYGETDEVLHIGLEQALVVFNHYSDLDWLGAHVFCERTNCLARTRVLMKDIVKFVPVFGWCLWFSEYGFMTRNWSKDRNSLLKLIDGCKRSQVPYIVSLCSEGTRRTDEKLKASQEYAMTKGIPVLKHHLVPRTKGFAIIANSLKDHVPAIYDCEFAFPDPENSTLSTLIRRGTVVAHLYARRIPISQVSCESEEEASEYLMNLFKEKDECMEYFEQNGKFNAIQLDIPRKQKNLITFGLSSAFVSSLIVYAMYRCDAYELKIVVGILVVIISMIMLTLFAFAHLTSTKRGSSFGLKVDKNK